MLDCNVAEVFNEGNFVGIRFTDDVTTLHTTNVSPVPSYNKCTEPRCEGGKYKKYDGSFGICYRCDGRGYITPAKAITNQRREELMEPLAFS